MALADGLDAPDAIHDVPWRLGVIVIGAWLWPGRQDAGIVRTAENDADAALLTERQEGGKRFLFQQRVAPGQQEQVEVATLRQRLANLPFVDAAAEGLDHALVAKRNQSVVARGHEFLDALV